MNNICREMEMLVSSMLDGEISSSEKEVLFLHLGECLHCRRFYEEQRKYHEFLGRTQDDLDVPACPSLSEQHAKIIRMPRYLQIGAAVILLALSFYGGFLSGDKKALERIPTYARVGAPAVWARNSSLPMEMDRKQLSPLQDLISEYQFQIGNELGRDEVNWQKVRTMLDTLGSLRTDLELLSLQMGFMDGTLQNRNSPRNTWLQLLGVNRKEESL